MQKSGFEFEYYIYGLNMLPADDKRVKEPHAFEMVN